MPTVHRYDGLRVVIYPNDHRPAHVHVKGADGEAVFILHCPEGRQSCAKATVSAARIGAYQRRISGRAG